MGFQRARAPAEKQARREAILAAAADLFDEEGLAGVSLNGIAREVGLAKSNLYRYFESREEIFLHLLQADQQAWIAEVERALAPLAGSGRPQAVATALAESLAARPRLCSLMASVTSVLERNLSADAVLAYKSSTLTWVLRLANALQVALPGLTPDDTFVVLRTLYSLVAGLWPAANPPPAVAEALERLAMPEMCVEFERDVAACLAATLVGLTPSTPAQAP